MFTRALMCACCPLLSVPELPAADSPTHSSSDPDESDGWKSPGLWSLRSRSSVLLGSKSPRFMDACEDPSYAMISADVLKETLRRSFGLNADLFVHYLRLAFEPYRKKQDAKVCFLKWLSFILN